MTPETEQAPPPGYFRRPAVSPREIRFPEPDAAAWPPPPAPQPPPALQPLPPAPQPPEAAPQPPAAKHGRDDESIVSVLPYLAILICTIAGVYVAWHQGSSGAGRGGVVGGAALLVAAFLRLVLPARFVGLLGSRNRVIDVLTLTVFGGSLLVAGLVLPR